MKLQKNVQISSFDTSIEAHHFLQVLEEDEEKHLALTDTELLKVLEEQVQVMLKSCPNQEMPVPEFLSAFMRYHGHSIRLSDYSVASVMELIDKIPNVAKVNLEALCT